MLTFTVIGDWIDNAQRFSAAVEAISADDAERRCLQDHPGVAVCGVIRGVHECQESAAHVASAE